MTSDATYEASPWAWVRDQVAEYEASGGTRANTLRDTGLPIVVVTTRGRRTGAIRKSPVMRVEHDGTYALIASKGGAPSHPEWYLNIVAHPDEVEVQDGPSPWRADVHEAEGDERAQWWARAVEAFPPYADYERKTQRRIPVLIATPRR